MPFKILKSDPYFSTIHTLYLLLFFCHWEMLFCHDDVIKWKHFPRYWPFVMGIHRSPVDSPHKGQWRGALMFLLICSWTNGWANTRDAGDLRRHRTNYEVTIMWLGSIRPSTGRIPEADHSPLFASNPLFKVVCVDYVTIHCNDFISLATLISPSHIKLTRSIWLPRHQPATWLGRRTGNESWLAFGHSSILHFYFTMIKTAFECFPIHIVWQYSKHTATYMRLQTFEPKSKCHNLKTGYLLCTKNVTQSNLHTRNCAL